jgi:hypothetical protein
MNKAIIYKLVGVVTLLLVGQGILGWPLYWLGLWFLLDWKYVYWLAFVLGFLLTGLTGMSIGLSSLMLVAGTWAMSFLRDLIGKDRRSGEIRV